MPPPRRHRFRPPPYPAFVYTAKKNLKAITPKQWTEFNYSLVRLGFLGVPFSEPLSQPIFAFTPPPARLHRLYKPEGHHAGLVAGAVRGCELDGPKNVPLRAP